MSIFGNLFGKKPHVTSPEFQRRLGADLAGALGGHYRFFRSRLELRADAPDGDNIVILAGSTKYSPHISVDFYFGRNFAEAKQVEKRLGQFRPPILSDTSRRIERI